MATSFPFSKRSVLILSFLFLILICFLLSLAGSEPNPDVFVSKAGSDDTGNGSQVNPYASIQWAIDQFSDGDLIFVAAGT